MTTININGIPFASQPKGTLPIDGDEILDGVLYRMVKIQTPAQKAGNKPPAQKPEEKTPAPKTEVKPPAPKVEEKAPAKTEPKAPAKAEDKAPVKTEVAPVKKDNTNRNLIIVGILLILALLVWNMFRNNAGGNSNGGSNTSPITSPTEGSNSSPSGVVSEATVLDLGSIGAYHAVMDSNKNQWTLGIWEEASTRKGVGLSEFKSRASSVSFVMPSDGTINNSAGHVTVNGTEWKLGNPIVDLNGNTTVPQGSNVTIWSDGANESFGFQIWFNK